MSDDDAFWAQAKQVNAQSNLEAAMAACRESGIDPIPLMVDELEAMGYAVFSPGEVRRWRR